MALHIKDNAADNGTAPTCGQNWWLSPSILLQNAAGTATVGQAEENVPMKIAVKVDSNSGTYQPALGPPPVQLTVQVWVCVPTASGVGPAAAIGAPGVPGTGSAGGQNGLFVTVPNPMQTSPPAITPAAGQWYKVDWTPQSGDLAGLTTRHLCVASNAAWNFNDPNPANREGAPTSSGYLDVCNNRLHAQRNIDLVAAGGGGGGMSAEFMVMAPEDEGDQVIRVELREAERGWRLSRAEELQLLGDGIATLAGIEKLDGDKYEETGKPQELSLLERGATLVLAGTDIPMRPTTGGDIRAELGSEHGSGDKLDLKLAGGELATVKSALTMAQDDEPGVVRAFDILTSTKRRRHFGAMRLLAVIAPDAKERQSSV